MSWFTRSLRVKLLAGFGAVLAVLVVVIVYSLSSAGRIGDKGVQIGESNLPSVAAIAKIQGKQGDYRRQQLQQLIVADANKPTYEAKMRASGRAVEQLLASYAPLVTGAEDRAFWRRAQSGWAAYIANTPAVLARGRANDLAGGLAILNGRLQKPFDAIGTNADAWSKLNADYATEAVADAKDTASSSRTAILLLGALAVGIALTVALLLARSIGGGVGQVLRAAEGIAEGELDQDVDVKSQDEVGQMAAAFRRLVDYVREMAAVAHRIAGGDLTQAIEPRSEKDELGVAFRDMQSNLSELIGAVSGSSQTLSAASQELASNSEEAGRAVDEIAQAVSDVAAGAEKQVGSVAGARVATEEVTEATRTSAESAQATVAAAGEARAVAAEGERAVEQATAAMREVRESSERVTQTMQGLAAKSEQIGGIVETITGIAAQTNLLALNAAIEAARAGEQGRGFAVVAEEVRKLAEESEQAAASIADLVTEMQGETGQAVVAVEDGAARSLEGAETVEQARDAFERIGLSVDDMSARIEGIATAVEQIASSAERVQHDMAAVAAVAESSSASSEQVAASTEQTSASAQEISSSAQQLAMTASELEELVGRFRIAS
ncbi:methyl-accepting chemotaxis protein [Patulibacter sp. SYSU D01012]|uniref:methyl-accepting chemotaxis protein n=1 Tax=Patulibacter sp. SYSU D01012 TaxID=2817381 RepID=UPI001B30331F|nr:methyl-accepting chemotaxis protein [Patulibacter sp. SYSU D01012]